MKKVLFPILLLASCFCAQAQKRSGDIKLVNDMGVHYFFDNREFALSEDRIIPSGTINVVDLNPSLGLSVKEGWGAINHKIMVGADIIRDMGKSGVDCRWSMYYDGQMNFHKGRSFEIAAGIVPRKLYRGEYGGAFFSDSFKFYDREIEGMLLKYSAKKFYSEIALDWYSAKGPSSREAFQILSFGKWTLSDILSAGWTAALTHFASSEAVKGVVDNHLFNPFAKVDFGKDAGLQELSLRASAMIGYQLDRRLGGDPSMPCGGEFIAAVKQYNVKIANVIYAGDNLQPLYYEKDAAGTMYGSDLYKGKSTYRQNFFDCAEILYEPKIGKKMYVCLNARFFFAKEGYFGWEQLFTLKYNL